MVKSLKELFTYEPDERVIIDGNKIIFHLDLQSLPIEYIDVSKDVPGSYNMRIDLDLECIDEWKFTDVICLNSPKVVIEELMNKCSYELTKIVSEYLVVQKISFSQLNAYTQEIENKYIANPMFELMGLKVRLFTIKNTKFSPLNLGNGVSSVSKKTSFKKKYFIPITIISIIIGIALVLGVYFLVKWYVDYMNSILGSAGI